MIGKSHFLNNSDEAMAGWSPLSDSDRYQDSNQDRLGFGKSERLFHSADRAMD